MFAGGLFLLLLLLLLLLFNPWAKERPRRKQRPLNDKPYWMDKRGY